jgi:putative ABC transport system permease protein
MRLLLSDLLRLWKQGLAIIALIAVGVATFIMSTNTMRGLQESRDRYYRNYRFADLFTPLVRAPQSLATSLSEIEGVESVQTRIVKEVLLDMPDIQEPVSGRLVSLDSPFDEFSTCGRHASRSPDEIRSSMVGSTGNHGMDAS